MFKFGMRKTAAAVFFILSGASAALAQPPDPTASDAFYNTAAGTNALLNVTGGFDRGFHGGGNTAIGFQALENDKYGVYNTASGANALFSNTGGTANTASGYQALGSNTTGNSNTALGLKALRSNTTGSYNTALGYGALYSSTAGSGNIAVGNLAGYYLQTGSNNIDIGNFGGAANESNTIRIGDPSQQTRAFIAGIRGVQTGVANAVAVFIDGNGQLGTLNSSARFKEDVRDMAGYSRRLLDLRPVTYHYKEPAAEGAKPLEAGLIAEEVAKIYPDLVTYDRDGQLETVQYHKLAPMLLNELQRQRRTLDAQAQEIVYLKAELEAALAVLMPGAGGR